MIKALRDKLEALVTSHGDLETQRLWRELTQAVELHSVSDLVDSSGFIKSADVLQKYPMLSREKIKDVILSEYPHAVYKNKKFGTQVLKGYQT